MRNLRWLNLFVAAILLAGAMKLSASTLIDVAFTGGPATTKTGFAATGVATNDFWNTCTTNGVANLEFVDGTPSGAEMSISGVEAAYTNGADDPMYGTYLYAAVPGFSSGILVSISNLSAAAYDFYFYGHGNEGSENSAFQLAVGSVIYGSQATSSDTYGWASPVWQQGLQYVEFSQVSVPAGQTVTITALPDASPYAFISGMQIMPSSTPYFITQPVSQQILQGESTAFGVEASGSPTLAFQWLLDQAAIIGATNSNYYLSNAQPTEEGSYSVRVTNPYGSITSAVAVLSVITVVSNLIDVDFTSGAVSSKRGFAAAGATSTDFWNACTVNGLTNLKFADGTASGVAINVSGAEGVLSNGAADPMYNTYFYDLPSPYNGWSPEIMIMITNLPSGAYDFFIYGHGNEDDQNALYELTIGSESYGSQSTTNGPGWLSPLWQQGVQYVKFANVSVPSGQPITVVASLADIETLWDVIAGLQIVPTPFPYIDSQPISQNVSPGVSVRFGVVAGGSPPLAYQWQFDNVDVANATNSSYSITNAQEFNSGSYSVIVTNLYGGTTSLLAGLSLITPVTNVIDVAFANDASLTSKKGFAATGVTVNDYWNNGVSEGVPALLNMDGTSMSAKPSLQISYGGVDGFATNGSLDPMYGSYMYVYQATFTIIVANLNEGLYNLYVYGHGNEDGESGDYQLTVGPQSYGNEADTIGPGWLSWMWQEGIQYVEFTNVFVAAGQPVYITAQPADNFALVSGLQIASVALPPNSIPWIIGVSSLTANANQELSLTNAAYGGNGPISFSLGSNAPTGAAITQDGVFYWTPTCEQGSTTNAITVWAADSSNPPLSNSMTFAVTVGPCVEVSIGSSVVQAGQSTCVPVNLVATVGLTNLNFTVAYPGGFLTNWNITASNSAVASAAANTVDASHTQFNFGVQNGKILQGTSLLGSICLDTLLSASAFVPLMVANVSATGLNNSPVTNFIGQIGRVVVIGPQSLLDASLGTNSSRTLTLYGNPGVSYHVLSTTNLTDNSSWITMTNVTLTDLFQSISIVGATNQMQFFKAVQP
jgi:hypothetical protein